MPPIVTLTSDFEEREPYVASAKGVLCARCPGVQIVDLSHEIPRQGVAECALFLSTAAPYFPAGTIHIVAVASGARPIAASLNGQHFVCPDNGVLTLLADRYVVDEARAITNPALNLSQGNQTYFARDVFAPAAAFLAGGGALQDVGERIEKVAKLDLPRAKRDGNRLITGQTIHVNRFGSLVTNIHRSLLDGCAVTMIKVGEFKVGGLSEAYTDVELRHPLALFGSSGYLEIAFNGDRADTRLKMGAGILVSVALEAATQ